MAGLYFAILIGSTTDEQLLKESGIVLPLLSVELPIVGFYIIAPWLFWLLHLNLLLLLRLLAGKIDRLPMRLPETFRHRLHTFPFTQLRAGPRQAGAARFLLWAMAWISIVALPVIVLMWAQARFLAYHGDWITFFHQLAVLADLALLWLLWPRAAASKGLVKALGYAVSIVLSLLLAAFSLIGYPIRSRSGKMLGWPRILPIPLAGSITLARSWNSTTGSLPRPPVRIFFGVSVGLTGFGVRPAGEPRHG